MDRLFLAKKLDSTLSFTLVTGHHMSVNLSAVGRDWVSGFTTAPLQHAVVLRVAAVECIEGFGVDESDVDAVTRQGPALSLMLENLARQSTHVVVHAATRLWRGTLCEAGADWCQVLAGTGALITIPTVRVLWLSAGSDLGNGDN
jgi:hypothetical protein